VKKVKIQDSKGKSNFFLSTLYFSPWAVLATWLHVGAPQKIKDNKLNTFLNKTSPHTHIELELEVLGVPKKLVKYVVYLSKRKN
jgi:hypothetical protein